MIKCRHFLQQLSEYLDGDAGAALRSEVERHICGCHDCWVVVDSCTKTIAFYQQQEVVELPSDLHDRLMRALQERCRRTAPPEART